MLSTKSYFHSTAYCFIHSFFRMCCYANCHSFLNLSEDDIEFVQNFVRNELLDILNDKCARISKVFDENDKHHFFGNYQASPQNFQILLGERKLLLAAAREVNRMNQSQSFGDYLKFFAVPEKYTISNKNTDKFAVGLYFGKKDRNAVAQPSISNEIMVNQVFAKVSPVFNKFSDSGLEAVRKLTKDIVKIVDFGAGIRADIVCVFCAMNDVNIEALQKTIAIQYEVKRGSTSGCWNTTNLRKHLRRHLTQNSSKQLKLDNSLEVDTNDVQLQYKPDVLSNNEQPHVKDGVVDPIVITLPENEKSAFFEKLSAQNLFMMRKVLENDEHKQVMTVIINKQPETVDVVDVDKDGNCVFSACVHQIHGIKLGSKEHYDKVVALRAEVVDHILKNFERFTRIIKFRIEEEQESKTGKRPLDVDESQCKRFIEEDLSQAGIWAGAESFMAISELYKVNMIGFNENDTYYFATGYNASYYRFIFLAYRLNSISQYYHYNSVCGINAALMYKCVSDLSKVVFNNTDDVQLL